MSEAATEISRARPATLSVRVPDGAYWREQIQCMHACPVHTDARGYIRALASGDSERAYLIARGPNPLASICGRVCGAPCEAACRRGKLDEPLAIRALKRYACDRHGPEARPEGGRKLIEFLKEAATRLGPGSCRGSEELLPLLQSLTEGSVPRVDGGSVGIIGSGPAGLAAAHDLALLGFSVTVYEMEPVLGGMLVVGIPEYRLPRVLVAAEVDVLTALGVEGVTGCCVGRDISFPDLRERHDAVIVAVGAKRSRSIGIPGGEGSGVLGGVEFLRDVSLGSPPRLGRRVVVIGGGNVAYDVGRSVLRQISYDTARTARRDSTVGEVHLCSLESLEEMPADDIEIIEGDEEGIRRHNALGPSEILRDGEGRVTGVRFQRCLRVFDENKQFSPVFDARDVTDIPCDTVLLSVGQTCDLGFVDPERDGLNLTGRGLIACNPDTGATNAPDVFVAGDLAYGTKLLIHAVASGKAVARAVYRQLTGRAIDVSACDLHFPDFRYEREAGYELQPRTTPRTLPPGERVLRHDLVVESSLTAEQARTEAMRCLDCGVNTIFDGERCILCGGCVDVCPQRCLEIVGVDRLEAGDAAGQSADVREAVARRLGGLPARDASAIVKDETICIRCGLCAERCPTGAITMERFCFEERVRCRVD